MRKTLTFFTILIYLSACNAPVSNKEKRDYIKTETLSEKNDRMQWWRDAGFGMFIHWGLYSVPAGQYGDRTNHAEWIQETANIPVKEYEKYADQFNPVKFNAKEWVRMAKDAGMKYIVITSKHHDGFALWNSDVSDYDMERTPYKKDLLKDMQIACEEANIPLCFYHSIMDWHHPQAQGINYPDYNNGTGPNPEFPKYVANYMYPQLKELLTNYGNIGVVWFDGEWIKEWTEEQGKELYNFLRNIQPNVIINNRVGKARKGFEGMNAYDDAAGDFGTPEQEILQGKSDLDWESCMTMNDAWGYNKLDDNFKSTKMLIHNLVDIAAKGGNYLLNVGPTADGLFPEQSIKLLKEIGDWMDVNGEVIHNSRGAKKYKDLGNVYYIQNEAGTILYAVLTEWPGNSIQMQYANPDKKSEIHLLGYDKPLNWEDKQDDGIIVQLPESWQSEENRKVKHAYVIKMEGKQVNVAETPQMIVDGKPVEHKTLFSENAIIELSSETESAAIYYTLDGSKPGLDAKIYKKPLVFTKSLIVRAITVKNNYATSPENKVEFIQSKAFSAVHFKYAYSEKYAALGDLTIGDSKFGEVNKSGENWLGFEGVDFDASIDLGETKLVNSVKASFLENIKKWIFLPEMIEISLSTDGEHYEVVKSLEIEKPKNNREAKSHSFELNFDKKEARYVQIKTKNISLCPEWHKGAGGTAWLFVDEVIIE